MTRTNWTSSKKMFVAAILLSVFCLALPAMTLAEEKKTSGASASKSDYSIVDPCATGNDLVQLDCVLLTLGRIASLILAVTGALALLMFVYGGFLMLSSGGRSDMVEKGKKTLTAAVIGIAIILLAGYLVRYGMDQLGVAESFRTVPSSPTSKGESDVNQDFILVNVGQPCCPNALYNCCETASMCAGKDCGPEEVSPAAGMCTNRDIGGEIMESICASTTP